MINFPGSDKQAAALKAIFNSNNLMTVTTAKKTIHWKTIESLFAKGFIDTCFKGHYVTDFAINRFFILENKDSETLQSEPTIETESSDELKAEKEINAVLSNQLKRTIDQLKEEKDQLAIAEDWRNLHRKNFKEAMFQNAAMKKEIEELTGEKKELISRVNHYAKVAMAAEQTTKHYTNAYNAAVKSSNQKNSENKQLKELIAVMKNTVDCDIDTHIKNETLIAQLKAALKVFTG